MNTLLIGYDLNKAGQDYTTLIQKIKDIGSWWHCLDSTWFVKTDSTPVAVRDYLSQYIDSNDEILVIRVTGGPAAWTGFDTKCSTWLKENL